MAASDNGLNRVGRKSVSDLADWYRAAYHGHLAVGRAIAGHAPAVPPLNHKWLLVSCAYTLVTQAKAWSTRLDELTVPLRFAGQPSPEVTGFAERLCRLDWQDALSEAGRYVAAWLRDMSALLSTGDLGFQDDRLLQQAGNDFAGLVGSFVTEGYDGTPCDQCFSQAHFQHGPGPGGDATTPRLPVRAVPVRAYPPEAALVTAYDGSAPDASDAMLLTASLHNALQIEFISIDIPLRNVAEFNALPLEFYADMVRQAHDEMLHARMMEANLHRLGGAIGDFPFVIPDRYDLMIEQDLIYRLVILSRTGESEAIEALSEMIPALKAAGEMELAMMWEYVLADEVRHTLFGNKWLRFLVGDDDAAVDRATRRSLALYNQAIGAGRLSKPPRPEDYLTTPGPAIETLLRSLAGFSAGEVDQLVNARGARPA